MATERTLHKNEGEGQKGKDASVEISYKKVDSSGKGSKKVREFRFHFSMNVLEPLKKLLTSSKFWMSVGGAAALGMAASGGWFLGRMEPLVERNPKACSDAIEIGQKPSRVGNLEVAVEDVREGRLILRIEGNEDTDKASFPLNTTGITQHAYLGREEVRVTACGVDRGKFKISLKGRVEGKQF